MNDVKKCPLCGNSDFITLASSERYYLPEVVPENCPRGSIQEVVSSEICACKKCGFIIKQLDDASMKKVAAFPNLI